MMTHGYVQRGRNITMHGDTANNWMAQQSARSCWTRERALEMIRSCSGSFRAALIDNLEGMYLQDKAGRNRKFVITRKLRKEIDADDKRAAELTAAWFRYWRLADLRAKEPKEAKGNLSIPCFVCEKPIKSGQSYRGTRFQYKSYRAHDKCANKKAKKPK